MKVILALAMLFAPAAAHMKYFSNNTENNIYAFNAFKSDFHKTYDTEEEEKARFAVFVENLAVIDRRNLEELHNGGSSVHGVTQFSDLSPSEFKARYLLSLPRKAEDIRPTTKHIKPLTDEVNVDWRGVYTTPVKNQGYCGSCWAFSATEQIETDFWIATGDEVILSPQQITSCDKTSFGCNGGLTERAYSYVERQGGIETESQYPYTSGAAGVTGSCDAAGPYAVSITGYETVSSSAAGESAMASYVASTGPLSICVDAETWSSYSGGVMTKCGNSVDHCVQAVGLDTSSSTPYWIVRNSWGVTWGEAGYIYLEYGKNLCELASDATYVVGASVAPN